MPPKPKDAKKPSPPVNRPAISDSSLVYVPEDAVEGFEERIETGIDWTLLEAGARHHREIGKREDLPTVTFSKALETKINNSILYGFLDKHSGLTLEQNWEFLLPVTLWDNEKFATEEGKVCFHNANCVTDDLVKLIKRTVKAGNRKVLRHDFKMLHTLRVNDSQMTDLDEGLLGFKELISLNLCGNYLNTIDTSLIPPSLRSLELQANRIKQVEDFAEGLPADLVYLGLARNFFTSETILGLSRLPYKLTVLDLSDNDIYHLEPVLEAVSLLPYLTALSLAGNPCAYSSGYARTTLMKLVRLQWLDYREVLPTDRPMEPIETHPDDLRSTYFNFVVYRVMAAPQPPKAEKGAATTFHVELEIPLLDVVRRRFLMFRRNESLIDMLPPPEDDEWGSAAGPPPPPPPVIDSKAVMGEESEVGSNIFDHMEYKNTREIHNFTTFESNRVQWSKLMNFQEPLVRIFCPDLSAVRDTFRSAITCRLIYSVTYAPTKPGRNDRKSSHVLRMPGEMRVVIATMKCSLKAVDWSQPYQHFHWDDSLGTENAIHWGEGDLSVLQYSQTPVKAPKGKTDGAEAGSRQTTPDNLTCHFGIGIETLKVA